MKRLIAGLVITVFCAATLAAQTYKDGIYFAQDAAYTGNQKNHVVLEVKGGKITSAIWNLLSLNANTPDLRSIARGGTVAGAVNWVKQASAVETFLVSSQNVNATSVAGGPANVTPFFNLVKKALAGSPVPKGLYAKDGWYFAIAPSPDDYHTRNSALVTVVNGTVVDALWNGLLVGMPANINPSKMITSRNNQYPMTGARSRWDQQAEATVAAFLAAQDPDKLNVKPDGHADGISGVTMQIKPYVDVAKQALQTAK